MPQMMPINWMMSLLFFIFIFLLFNIMNYFIFTIKNNPKKLFFINKKLKIWKW